jgi:hypothetical protein
MPIPTAPFSPGYRTRMLSDQDSQVPPPVPSAHPEAPPVGKRRAAVTIPTRAAASLLIRTFFLFWRLRLGRGRDEAGSGPLRTTFARHSYSRVRQGDLLAKGGGVNLEPVDRPPRRRSGSTFGENASLLDASGLFPRRLEPATVRRRCGELVGVQALDASLFAAALRDLLQARFSQRSSAAEPQIF